MKNLTCATLSLALLLGVTACDNDGPAEELGENIDNAAESVGDTLDDACEDVKEATGANNDDC